MPNKHMQLDSSQLIPAHTDQDYLLPSGVLYSPAGELLAQAIIKTLEAPASDRIGLFTQFAHEIKAFVAEYYPRRRWSFKIYTGTDGSQIYRGTAAYSIVIDGDGRLWRANDIRDFETTYLLSQDSCEIKSLRPLYEQMREYKEDEALRAAANRTESPITAEELKRKHASQNSL